MKKLKFQYLQPENTHPNDGIRQRYPHLRNVYHKKFSTLQERSFYFLHLIDGPNFLLRPKSFLSELFLLAVCQKKQFSYVLF